MACGRGGCTFISQPKPCCLPSKENAEALAKSERVARERKRVTGGSLLDMELLMGGFFLMGSEGPEALISDGEGPVIEVYVSPFYICRYAVTNEEFAKFVLAKGYQTDAERHGWSFVFQNFCDPTGRSRAPYANWWVRVFGAEWRHPEGPGSCTRGRERHPVVHVSWNDAVAYCEWAKKRLPTEAEWEFAARGGLVQKKFPWGDKFRPGGKCMCNIFQGRFPDLDAGEDGYIGTAPVDTFPQNGFKLHHVVGNVWEWCWDRFHSCFRATATRDNPAGPPTGENRVVKGGSYLCDKSYCFRYRCSARTSNTPDSSTGNMGFRVAMDAE